MSPAEHPDGEKKWFEEMAKANRMMSEGSTLANQKRERFYTPEKIDEMLAEKERAF